MSEVLAFNQVHAMSCMEGLRLLSPESIDLVVTDPPYKLTAGGCTNRAVRLNGASQLGSGKVFTHNTITFAEWLPEVYRVLKQDTHCYIMVNDRNMLDLLTAAKQAGFQLLNILTWKKTKHTPNRYYLKNSEFIVFLRKGKAKNIHHMGSYQVLEVSNVPKKQHPSQKPIELLNILITNSSNPQDLVLDPFMGSGSTAVTCLLADRQFIGFELDDTYLPIIQERLQAVRTNQSYE